MRIYKFFDTDLSGIEEYDISGEHYLTLLTTCFKYCSTVAVIISPDCTADIELWEKYRIPLTDNVRKAYCHYGHISNEAPQKIGNYEIRHYQLNQYLNNMILSHTDSLFKWLCGWGYNNPNDLTFFRADGSIFFSSIVHEGVCTLFPNEYEDITDILNHGHWILMSH